MTNMNDGKESGCTNSDMIVEFPNRCWSTYSSPQGEADRSSGGLMPPTPATSISPTKPAAIGKTINKKRSVRFSERTRVTLISYPTREEISHRWYSEPQRQYLKSILLQDLRRMARKLATTPMEEIGTDDLFRCIGMEALLAPGLNRAIRERKRGHARSVLAMQAHYQDSCGIVDEVALANVARKTSEWSGKRAHKLAAGYWTCLKDQPSSSDHSSPSSSSS